MKPAQLALAAALVFAASGSIAIAASQDAPVMKAEYQGDIYLIDANKMTLYTFDNDRHGVSNCSGECAIKWPPLTVEAGTALPYNYSLIRRADGSMQIAYKGHPLYRWFKDQHPTEQTGDGVKGVWHVARP